MAEKMKAVEIKEPGDYEYKTVDKAECPAGGLLIEVLACGLCGSDLRILASGHDNISFPWIIGHEVSGKIVETGAEYGGFWEKGDILAVAPVVYCGECEFCLNARYEFCDNIKELAQNWPGGFAEYMSIPEESLKLGTIREIPKNLDPVQAAVAEPASSVINAQEKGKVGFQDTVVIIGAGPIGCIHTSLARAKGARQVITADIKENRLEKSESFGADITINAEKKDLVDEVKKMTKGLGADVVITANPVPETQVQAINMAKKGGRILFFGGLPPDKSKPGIDTNTVHYRGLHVIGTTTFAPRHHLQALDLFRSGAIPGDKLITHKMPLSKFAEGVRLARAGKALKVVFLPGKEKNKVQENLI